MKVHVLIASLAIAIALGACAPAAAPTATIGETPLRVVAVETFLADVAQNVAGDRVRVESLVPAGMDPHNFEPTPADVKKVAESRVLIVNGAGLEVFLEKLLQNAGGQRLVIEASQGLAPRQPKEGEPGEAHESGDSNHQPIDPHFWLDPISMIRYVENIRDGLSQADPEGAEQYRANAEAYISKLRALDASIKMHLKTVPPENLKLVTDHDTFGYFADRYGLQVIGMLVPSFSTADGPTAQELAELVDAIKATGVKAIFLEQGANPRIAEQIRRETGVQVVTGLYSHSLSGPDGPAPTYIEMMEFNARQIAEALR